MKVNSARILCLILVILMSITVFSGCKKETAEGESSASEEVTSIAPPAVIAVESEGYKINEGSTIVTVVTDTVTNLTVMKVATDTTLAVFKQEVTSNEGYSYKIFDTTDVEITDEAAIITNGYKFMLYKDGETEAIETYTISVVTQEEIINTNSEVAAESSRYEAEKAAESSRIAASQANVSNPSLTNGGRSEVGVSSTETSSQSSGGGGYQGYDFVYRTHRPIQTLDEANLLWSNKLKEIGSKCNMNMDVSQDPQVLTASVIANAVLAGEKYADLIETTTSVARSLAKTNSICDFNESTTLLKDQSYFSTGIRDGFNFQGKQYAISFTSMGTSPQGVTFNKKLVSLYAPDYDIYSMYKNGTWTADVFTELMKLCSKNLDSNPNTYEVYGMTSNTNVIGIALSAFSGGTLAKDPTTGYVYPCFITDAGIQSLEWCKNAYDNNYWKYNADIYQAINYFASGSAATVVTYMWAVTQAAPIADFEMGFVPFPKGGSRTDYVTQTYSGNVFIVPLSNSQNLDKVGTVINELSSINDEAVNLQIKAYENVGLDDIGCGVYRWALTNTTPDLSGGVCSAAISTAIDTSVTNSSKQPASAMAAIASQAIAETNDYYRDLTGQDK